MGVKSLLSHLRVPSDGDIFHDALLLPKDRDGTPNLNMAEEESVIDNKYLLSLHLIAHISFVVNPTSVVASTSSMVYSP